MRPTWTRLTLPVLLAGMLSFAAAVSAIAENQASVTVGATAVEVLEGGNGATYTVVLDSEPTGDVVIAITPDDQLTADVAELTFTTANWNIEQLVTVTAVDDVAAEGEHAAQVTHAATSADGGSVRFQVTDGADETASRCRPRYAAASSTISERQRARKSRRCSARETWLSPRWRARKYCRSSSNAAQKRDADSKLPKPSMG